ncbi:MAG: phosphoenolpyruvate--protein phosphotransferase [Gammaproteobacteria bacterium]|nr:phosphoenolpyruvate--protein phosphotransferase [Gammaproteobacteria bacterium]
MSLVLSGISVTRGVAIGKSVVLHPDQPEISEHTIPRPLLQEEVTRYRVALRKARQQLHDIRKRIPADTPGDITAFMDAHLLMLDDGVLSEAPVKIMRARQCNAEWALKLQRDTLVRVVEEMDDPYLRTRRDDVDHVVNRILRNLQGQYDPDHDGRGGQLRGAILIAADVSPAETMLMHQQGIAAVVTEYGGPNSHTAILARSLGLPTVVGVHQLRRYLRSGEPLVVDAENGMVIAGADAGELVYYRRRQREERRHVAELNKLRERPAVTRDGHAVTLMANVELPEEATAARRLGAAGVGLFRTEMLFLNRETLPEEDEQYEAYLRVVRAMKGVPVTIRTLDLGADKCLGTRPRTPAASNPALGLRAIRWCLKDPGMFSPQIRAILRVSAHGPVRMMIPMLSGEGELLQALRLISEEKKALEREGIRFDPAMPVGGMIEVPAAALAADILARHLDFFSIGTNDLIQYTLAVDRLDEEVNYLYDPLHPAILRLIQLTIRAGRRAGIPVAMCGEMAGDPYYTRLLLGLGLREFSMFPATLLEVKRVINGSKLETLDRDVRRVMRSRSSARVTALIDELNRPR